jgi:dTDP-glucose 4,6-dehydratase
MDSSNMTRGLKLLVTGGCGFIASNFIRHVMRIAPDWQVTNLDKLTYAGNMENLTGLEQDPRYHFHKGDAADSAVLDALLSRDVDTVVHFAAQTHVDRSISGPTEVWRENVLMAESLLSAVRRHGTKLFVQISTDEVYGSLGSEGRFTESTPLHPNNPYSASKAAGDLLAQSFHNTYATPVVIVRGSNNYGPYQFPEKFIPLCITNAIEDKPLPIYGDGLQVRDWTYVEDFCAAVVTVIERGIPGEVYNVGGDAEAANISLAEGILDLLGKPRTLITHVKDRPGHDRRYAMDHTRISESLGWRPRVGLREGLARTVEWYKANRMWWERIKSGAYRDYYEQHYVRTHGLTKS